MNILTVNLYPIQFLAKEMHIWSNLEHVNILPFQGYLLENDYPSFISEWIENGTAKTYLVQHTEYDIVHLVRRQS